jgi:hypothetical protein
VAASAGGDRPVLPPDVPQQFAPAPDAGPPTYRPRLLGAAQVRFTDARTKVDVTKDVVYATEIQNGAVTVDWNAAEPLRIDLNELQPEPAPGARFLELPPAAAKARNYAAWAKAFTSWLTQSETVRVLRSPSTGAISNPDETERDFRARLQHSAREARDQCADELRRKYTPKMAALQERLRRAQQALDRETEQARAQKLNTAISVGATVLGAFLGRRSFSASTLGRASTAARAASRTAKESNEVERAAETVQSIEQQLADLNAQFERECSEIDRRTDPMTETLDTIEIRPKRNGITVKLVCLLWIPAAADREV